MKRLSTIVTVIALSSAFAAAGCKKKEETKVDDTAATKPAEGAAVAATTPTAPAADPAMADPAAPTMSDPAAVPAVEPTADEKALAEKAVAMLEELATAAEATAADCDKAAASMKGIVDKNKDLIEKGKELDKDPGKKVWFEQTYKARIEAATTKMVPVIGKCQSNKAFTDVFQSM